MIAQLYEYAKNHLILYSKAVNCIICEWYLNKSVRKNSSIFKNILEFLLCLPTDEGEKRQFLNLVFSALTLFHPIFQLSHPNFQQQLHHCDSNPLIIGTAFLILQSKLPFSTSSLSNF